LSDMRTVRPQGLTFRITQLYGLRVWHLRIQPSRHKDEIDYFHDMTVFSHHDYDTTISKYAMENDDWLPETTR